jgi:hypothetical protein
MNMTFTKKTALPAIVCATMWFASSSSARPQQGIKKGQNPNAPIIAQLQATIVVLKQADHDYQGHRVKAIQQIHMAVKALGGKHRHAKIPAGSGKLPQNVSDGLLQKAVQQLIAVQTMLANSVGPGNRPAAGIAIHNAITELQTALKIR